MPSGINDEGQVVGNSVPSTKPGSIVGWGAVLCSGGVTTVLPGLAAGNYTSAYAINDSGQVVGGSGPDELNPQAFLYANGTTASLGTLGGTASLALGINGSGQIVGSCAHHCKRHRPRVPLQQRHDDPHRHGRRAATLAAPWESPTPARSPAWRSRSPRSRPRARPWLGQGRRRGSFSFTAPRHERAEHFAVIRVLPIGGQPGQPSRRKGLRPLGIDPTFYSGPLAYENGASASLGTWTYADLFPNADTAYGVNSSEVVGSTVSTVSATAAYPFVYANGTTADRTR